MLAFLTTPAPHAEAAARIAAKPAVMREVFDSLTDEMKSRAFTVTGIEDFDALQAVRDQAAKIPAGAEWAGVKQDIIRKMSPWLDEQAAATRAELLMRFHAGQAYASAQARIADAMIDVFPFRQYHTNHGPNVRDSHAALDGLILPAAHEFWKTHTPHWEFNCHCFFTSLTQEDRDEVHAKERTKPPESRQVLDPAALDQLAGGRISRGPSQNFTLGPSLFHVDATTLPYDQIKKRWDPATAADFETWAGKQAVGTGNLLQLLTGKKSTSLLEDIVLPDPSGKGTLHLDPGIYDALRAGAARLGHGRAFAAGKFPAAIAAALPEFLKVEARVLAGAAVEESVLITRSGDLRTTTGSLRKVTWADEDLAGALMSHTHPAGGTLGPGDIRATMRHKMVGTRAHAGRMIYSVAPGPQAKSFNTREEMEADPEFQAAHKEAWAVVNRLQSGYGWEAAERAENATHLTWIGLERRGWITYHEEKAP